MVSRGIRGTAAAVKWAYFTAATVHAYLVTKDQAGAWSATGSLTPGTVDPYKLAQRPLFLVAPFKRGAWRWEIKQLTVLEGGRFTATLGTMSTEGTNGLTRPTTRY